jgi:hypothetical protein
VRTCCGCAPNFFPTLLVLAGLGLCYGIKAVILLMSATYRYLRDRDTINELEQIKTRFRLLLTPLILVTVAFGLFGAAVFISSAPRSAQIKSVAMPLLLILAALILTGAVRQFQLNRLGRRLPYRVPKAWRRLVIIREQQHHAFKVYSGPKPFVGNGDRILGWSFAQRLLKSSETKAEDVPPEDPASTFPFTGRQLMSHLRKELIRLRNDEHPEARLPGLEVEDRVYLEGTYAPQYSHLLHLKADENINPEPDHDEISAIDEAISEIVADSGGAARHYLTCQVKSWGGEIVTTVFVHVSLQGRLLYLEFATYALRPTRPEYHVVDEIGGVGPTALIKAIFRSLTELPDVLLTPVRV